MLQMRVVRHICESWVVRLRRMILRGFSSLANQAERKAMLDSLFARAHLTARFQGSPPQPHLPDLARILNQQGHSRNVIRHVPVLGGEVRAVDDGHSTASTCFNRVDNSSLAPKPIVRSCGVENDLGTAEPARGVTTPHDPELRMIATKWAIWH